MRPAEATDLERLTALFDARFGHPISREEWEWKYRRLPGEARSWVAVGPTGDLLAHAGALCLPARLEIRPGELGEAGIWQLTDWVGSTAQTGLRPPLLELGRRLLADLPRPQDAPWIFGFPSPRHFRLGRRVFGYRPLPGITPLAGDLETAVAGAGATAGADRRVEASDHCGAWPEAAEAAWASCNVLGVRRSAAFLNWRYHARPGRYYRFYRLRTGMDPEGLAVFAFVGREAWAAELWLPAQRVPAAAWEPVLRAVAADLLEAGLERWTFWPPPRDESGGVTGLLHRLGLRPVEREILMGCRGPVDPDPRFHYSMGDYDVV